MQCPSVKDIFTETQKLKVDCINVMRMDHPGQRIEIEINIRQSARIKDEVIISCLAGAI